MPEIGGKSLAGDLRSALAGLRKVVDETKLEVAGAVSDVTVEVKNMKEVAKRLRAEANEMRQASAEMLGNESASDVTDKPAGET